MESAGSRLKKIRLEKGISIEEAQKKTKLHINIIKGIEEDGIVNVSPAYLKGFLKIYCDFLGQDPRDFLNVNEPGGKISETKSQPKDKAVKYPKLPSVKLSPPRPFFKTKTFWIVVSLLVIFLFLRFVRFYSARRTGAYPNAKLAVPVSNKPRTIKEIKVVTPKKIPAPVVLPKAKTSEKKVASQPLSLVIYVKEDSWVEVKIDGKTILKSVLKKGRTEAWQAKEKIELTLGNAGAIELEVDAKRIAPLGRRGQAVKNILITKKGLSIGR